MNSDNSMLLDILSYVLRTNYVRDERLDDTTTILNYIEAINGRKKFFAEIRLKPAHKVVVAGIEYIWKPTIEMETLEGELLFIETERDITAEQRDRIITNLSAIINIMKDRLKLLGGIFCEFSSQDSKCRTYAIKQDAVAEGIRVYTKKLDEKGTEMAIIRVLPDVPNPQNLLNEAIGNYVKNDPYNIFAPQGSSDTGVRVVIKGINNLDFHVPETAL